MLPCNLRIRTRFIIAGMLGAAAIIDAIVQGSMSVAIVAMTENIYDTTELPNYGPRYKWTAYDQGLVLSSFFWGNAFVGTFAGVLAGKFGARRVAGCAIILHILTSALIPVAASHLWILIVLRFFAGTSVGSIFSSSQELIAKWAPAEERGKFIAACMLTGVGTVIDWSLSGVIIANVGWHFTFYAVAVVSAVFAVIWYFMVFDSPTSHPRISQTEKEFILSRISADTKRKWPPIGTILLSIPFWALIICHFGCLWGAFFFATATPKYLTEVHGLTITTTGYLSSIPQLARLIGAILFGIAADELLKRKILGPTAIRKWFVVCSHIIPGLFLIALAFVANQPYVSVALMTLSQGFNGAMTASTMQNPHDIAPNFSSAIFGWMLTASATSGFIAPLVVAHYTKESSTQDEWFYIFIIGAAVYIGTAVIFLIFGTGRRQKWNELKPEADVDKSSTKMQD